ncbi:amidohydrolase [Nocardioides immobilis]|uniref:Amidohydrolase n=2 Tax=Nocardioides immobilis TaxID=2049295 RepID=A0A417XSQ9_9ACTN|nr:amidohydrolase [Nocardioides immobilis]
MNRRSLLGMAATGAAAAAVPIALATAARAVPVLTGPRNRIDVHCHHIPDFYRQSLAEHGIDSAGGKALPAWSPQAAVTFMNRFGIAAQVVSISEPGVAYLPTATQRDAMARRINDYTYETLINGSGTVAKRFGGFAVLPLGDLDDPAEIANARAEATRAIKQLGFDGVGLFSQYRGVYLGDDRLKPLMKTLNQLGAMVFVHPVTPVHPDLGLPAFLFEFPFDTTRAAVNLSYHRTFTLYPRIRWLLAHAGGTLPFLAYRTSLLQYVTPIMQNLGLGVLDEQNLDYGRLFYDTALSPAPSAMMSVREVAPVSHIMFATDWPFSAQVFTIPGDPAPQLKRSFDSTELRQVLHGNALTQLPALRKRLGG